MGVNQGPVPVSRSFILLLGMVYIFSVLYYVCTSGRAGQWGKTCIFVESCCILPSNNKLLFVKLFLWA